MFKILHIVDAERVELVTCQLNGIARVWFDQWKNDRVEDAPILSLVVFESALMGYFNVLVSCENKDKRGYNP